MSLRHDASRIWSEFLRLEATFRSNAPLLREEAFDEFLAALHVVDGGLFFEVGGSPGGGWKLIITAEGRIDLFDTVDALVLDAPTLGWWEIIALIPPRGFGFVTTYGAATVDPSECRVAVVRRRETRADLLVTCPGFSLEHLDAFVCAVRLALTNALGEREFAQSVSHIEVEAPTPSTAHHPLLEELPRLLANTPATAGTA